MGQQSPSSDEVARIVQVLRTSNVRDRAYKEAEQKLLKLGKAAIPALNGLLTDPDKVVRERARELLGRIGTP